MTSLQAVLKKKMYDSVRMQTVKDENNNYKILMTSLQALLYKKMCENVN